MLNSTKICTQETEINILLGSVSKASAHLNFSKKTGNTVKPEKLFIIATKKWNSVAHRHNKAYSVNQTQSSSTYYVNQRNWSPQSFGNCIQRSKELNFSLMAFLYGPSFLTNFFLFARTCSQEMRKKWVESFNVQYLLLSDVVVIAQKYQFQQFWIDNTEGFQSNIPSQFFSIYMLNKTPSWKVLHTENNQRCPPTIFLSCFKCVTDHMCNLRCLASLTSSPLLKLSKLSPTYLTTNAPAQKCLRTNIIILWGEFKRLDFRKFKHYHSKES